jgi:IPT/TIG domain
MSPATTKVQLGAATTVRKWYLDVNTGTTAAPIWTGVFGVTNFKPSLKPTWKDTSDFDSGGDMSSTATARAWSVDLKLERKSTASDPTTYDPGQEALRLKAENIGLLNSIGVRFYEMEPGGPRLEAYQGIAGVEWSPDGGAMSDTDGVSVTLTGQGRRTLITHPDTVASVPVIYSFTPITGPAAGGTLVTIHGVGFTGAVAVGVTGVKFGATNATSFAFVDDDTIVAIAPAHAAGAVAVVVTNATGPSITGASYTYV